VWDILRRCQNSDCIASDGMITNKRCTGKDLKGSGRGLIELLSECLPGGKGA
jgi:hypothetical protein